MSEKTNVISDQDHELIDQIDIDFKKFVETAKVIKISLYISNFFVLEKTINKHC